MKELTDYSGPFNPSLSFDNFSKDFLLKLIQMWQWSWIQLDSAFFNQVLKRADLDTSFQCATESWVRIAEDCNPRYAKIAKIPLTNAVDSVKVYQLPLDNPMGTVYKSTYDIQNENSVTVTVGRCPTLEWAEKNAPERIVPMCHDLEGKVIEKYKVNMDVQFTQLVLPPRQSPDQIACSFQLTLEAPEGVTIRGKEDVVDETMEPP